MLEIVACAEPILVDLRAVDVRFAIDGLISNAAIGGVGRLGIGVDDLFDVRPEIMPEAYPKSTHSVVHIDEKAVDLLRAVKRVDVNDVLVLFRLEVLPSQCPPVV